MHCPPLSELPQGMVEIGCQVPESRWSRVMEFHLLVMSMYRMSTEAMDRLLLLSLQFLPKTRRDMSPRHQTGPGPSCPMPLPGLRSPPDRPPLPRAGTNEGCMVGNGGREGWKCTVT